MHADPDGQTLRARVAALRPGLIVLLGSAQQAMALDGCAPQGCWHLDHTLLDPASAARARRAVCFSAMGG